jgi:hypothetical protein
MTKVYAKGGEEGLMDGPVERHLLEIFHEDSAMTVDSGEPIGTPSICSWNWPAILNMRPLGHIG